MRAPTRASMLTGMRWNVTTDGLPDAAAPADHGTAADAWSDYHGRVSDLESRGYRLGAESSLYGRRWVQALARDGAVVRVVLETRPSAAAADAPG
jgi:hypothetical protein